MDNQVRIQNLGPASITVRVNRKGEGDAYESTNVFELRPSLANTVHLKDSEFITVARLGEPLPADQRQGLILTDEDRAKAAAAAGEASQAGGGEAAPAAEDQPSKRRKAPAAAQSGGA